MELAMVETRRLVKLDWKGRGTRKVSGTSSDTLSMRIDRCSLC